MTEYVVIRQEPLAWAFEASRVREIRSVAALDDMRAVDVGQLWGLAACAPTRAVVIGDLVAVAAPALAYAQFDAERLAPLPREWNQTRAARYVAGVIFDDEHGALVVLDVEGLKNDTDQ